MLSKIKADAAAEAEKLATKMEVVEEKTSMDAVPEASSAASHNPGQNGQILKIAMTPKETKSSDKALESMATKHPVEGVPNEIVSFLNHGQSLNEIEPSVIPTNAESNLGGSASLSANSTPASAPPLQKLPTGVRVPPTQGLPHFPTADILHSMDQPIGIDDSMHFPPASQPMNLDYIYGVSESLDPLLSISGVPPTCELPSLNHLTGHFSPTVTEPGSIEVANNHPTDISYQQETLRIYGNSTGMYPQNQQPGPSDLGRTTEVRDLISEQTMQNPMLINNVVPGWHGDGNASSGFP